MVGDKRTSSVWHEIILIAENSFPEVHQALWSWHTVCGRREAFARFRSNGSNRKRYKGLGLKSWEKRLVSYFYDDREKIWILLVSKNLKDLHSQRGSSEKNAEFATLIAWNRMPHIQSTEKWEVLVSLLIFL